MNIRHASGLLPLSLSDEQMQVVMLAVASLPTEKRDLFLRRFASLLRFGGGRRHGDTDVKIAVRLALAVLSIRRGRGCLSGRSPRCAPGKSEQSVLGETHRECALTAWK